VTMNRKTRNAELDIGTDGSSQTWQNPRVYGYGSGFGLPILSGSGFWTGLEPNRPVFAGQTLTAGGLPEPIANTNQQRFIHIRGGYGQPTTRPVETSKGRRMHIDPAQSHIHNYQLPGSKAIACEGNWLQIGLQDETQSSRHHTIRSTPSN